jgi:hypothetical protein
MCEKFRGRGLRWQQDDTNSALDTEHFQNIPSILNLNPAEVKVFAKDDRAPGWSVNDKVRSKFRAAADALVKPTRASMAR